MKNIVKFEKIKLNGSVTIDGYNPAISYYGLDEVLEQFLPYTKLFEKIVIKNFTRLPDTLLSRLTNQYLHGAIIEIDTPSRKFNKTYRLDNAKSFYSYKWVPLDLSAPVPKSLANFKFIFNGVPTTYINAISTLKSTKYLPNDIWVALDQYSQQQISKCREHNRGDYGLAEQWYKDLMHDCMNHSIKVFSPNQKTYFEVIAEINFDKECSSYHLQPGLRPLSEEELAYLRKYAPAYGIEIPKFQWKINSRKTDHGYTEEPEVAYCGMSTTDYNRVTFDPRNSNNLPKFVRQGLRVRECDNDKLLREAYFQLKWVMSNLKDDGLIPGYSRCPKCHEIYREHNGCECGHCQPIEFVSADHLLYGITSSYEDYDSTHCAYENLD